MKATHNITNLKTYTTIIRKPCCDPSGLVVPLMLLVAGQHIENSVVLTAR